jgi:hypothetical protein
MSPWLVPIACAPLSSGAPTRIVTGWVRGAGGRALVTKVTAAHIGC